MVHILIYHYVMKFMHIIMMQLSFGIHFWFAKAYQIMKIIAKGLRNTYFNNQFN